MARLSHMESCDPPRMSLGGVAPHPTPFRNIDTVAHPKRLLPSQVQPRDLQWRMSFSPCPQHFPEQLQQLGRLPQAGSRWYTLILKVPDWPHPLKNHPPQRMTAPALPLVHNWDLHCRDMPEFAANRGYYSAQVDSCNRLLDSTISPPSVFELADHSDRRHALGAAADISASGRLDSGDVVVSTGAA
jgi:hypothetical protein